MGQGLVGAAGLSRTPRMSSGSSWLHRHVGARLALLLAAPLTWLVAVYLAPLGLLFLTAFWRTDSFTGLIERRLTVRNIVDVFGEPAYLGVLVRTVAIALAVTVICTVIGVPMALFMAKVAAARWRPVLLALVLTPLWASYLVKVYAWRTLLSATGGLGLGAVVVVLTYLWLPYMVLPLYTGLAGMRPSLLDAAADLGARPWRTVRTVVLPLLAPSVAAGSIFTFSLSMGDYITVQLVGGTTQMLGNVVYQNFSTNLPFAATVAALPVVVMIGYLLAARRSGALEEL
jgi:putative spermidine/putrescine transport system permease protein